MTTAIKTKRTKPRTKVNETGIRLKFDCYTEIPKPGGENASAGHFHLDVEVLIISAERWKSVNKKGARWDGQLLDNGQVVAIRITDKEDAKRKLQSHDAPAPWEAEQLRKVRSQVLDFFEGQDDVGGLELEAGGNGECVIRVTKEGDTRKYKRAMPDGFNIRLDCKDPMCDE
jgi:hypothetical protein